MKKFFSAFMFVTFMICIFCAQVYAADLSVDKMKTAPQINGKMDAGEWDNYKITTLDAQTHNIVLGDISSLKSSGTYYGMWSSDGFYGAVKILNDTTPVLGEKGKPLNNSDCIQVIFEPLNKKGQLTAAANNSYIFSLTPNSANNGPALWWEHWSYGEESKQKLTEMPDLGVKVAGERTDKEYTIEYFIPWSSLKANGEEFNVTAETKMGMSFLMIDRLSSETFVGIGTNKDFKPAAFDTVTMLDSSLKIKNVDENSNFPWEVVIIAAGILIIGFIVFKVVNRKKA